MSTRQEIMIKNQINAILKYIETETNCNFTFDKDAEYFYNYMKTQDIESISIEELEKLNQIALKLDMTYDILNELNYYFDPIYISIRNNMHKESVEKIRENNRRKRETKNG